MRILAVDDGSAMPEVIRHLSDGIAAGTHVVNRVASVAEGFGAFIDGDLDVCVIDHRVGARTGFDLLARISADGLRVPVVFIAPPADHGTGISAVNAGASCYVVENDLSPVVLDHCIRHAIGQSATLARLTEAGVVADGGSPTRSQILSHIAERLGAPTAHILNEVRQSLGSQLPTHTLESLIGIERQAMVLLTLANDLHDLSLLDSGQLRLDAVVFDLRRVVSSVMRIVESSAAERHVQVVSEVSPDVPDSLVGDPSRLRHVIVRFLDNVIAQVSAVRVDLLVEVEESSADAVTLLIDIHAESLATTDGETPTGDRGRPPLGDHSALGIPVALETVARMGGRIIAGGVAGHAAGARFTVHLETSDDATGIRSAVDYGTPTDGLILVIADTARSRHSIVKSLNESGMSYISADTVEAWAEMREKDAGSPAPTLAILESARNWFGLHDDFIALAGDSIPVVLIAGSGQRGDAAECSNRGVRGYLARPVDPEDLVGVTRAAAALTDSNGSAPLVTRHWLRERRSPLRILVVDDSPTVRFLITRMLHQHDHVTETATDGREAVRAIENSEFDVVLMDAMMPGMDGLEATRLICAMYPAAADRPLIIGMSAFADETFRERGREVGMDAFLPKPLRPDDLFEVVERHLAAQSA